jgi:ABC-2 type transport system permease protein
VVFRLAGEEEVDPERWTARVLFLGLIVTVVLPLIALFVATSAIGDEVEDGTVIHLLTKPIERWQILVPKLLASWVVISALLVGSAVPAALISLRDGAETAFILGIAIALLIGGLAYATIFVFLSVSTSRALITGLIYVFLWEGAITAIFDGARYLSVRHYTVGIADWIANTSEPTFEAYVNGGTALVLSATAVLAGALMANRRLQRLEVREPS